MIRLFAGLALPNGHRQQINLIQNGLKDARWVAPENLHVTLRFIGEVDEDVVDELSGALDDVRAEPFTLTIQGLGTFGRPPSSVWAGVEDTPAGALAHLQAKVESVLVRSGLPPEGRKYTPHVTLARLRKSPGALRLGDYMESHGALVLPAFEVTGFTLFESRLSHQGAHYSALAEYKF